jgi:transposase-like protein
LEGRYPYVFLDAKVEQVRDGGRVVNKALVIAHGVHETGRREILGTGRAAGRNHGASSGWKVLAQRANSPHCSGS